MRIVPSDGLILLILGGAIAAYLLFDLRLFETYVLPFALAVLAVRLGQYGVSHARRRRAVRTAKRFD